MIQNITTMEEIDEIINKPLSIVIAKSRNCNVCDAIKIQIEQLLNNDTDVPVYDIYIDEIEEFRGRFLVFTVPTVLIFSNQKEQLRESRFIDINKIKRLIELYKNNN